ncbi:DUF1697 domain-containing protein [Ruficoccus sp. ZRK36]|uniref:DUF1697 domain-containing protein n=1 Tax=Ruficoccus sp. ZRK36 TaxID=2866311 RepID=UPI001C72A3D0|nr:DUF1697 domain-containing protein [Ruficoccus sp. ZRK36]QYY36640.1 DUF1697 domain-containing protein [Ruficoccus sp. ZRK36]
MRKPPTTKDKRTSPRAYVALLRGINVGGKNKIPMPVLRQSFERVGMTNVATYINSGNVIFTAGEYPQSALAAILEKAIEEDFGLEIPVLVRSREEIAAVHAALPSHWENGKAMKADVLFLWDEVDEPAVLERLPLKPGLAEALYVPGAVIVGIDRANVSRSGLSRLVGSRLYAAMTIRNVNTLRRIHALLSGEE